MVLDIESFRPQEDPEALGPDGVREIQTKRFKDVDVVQTISDLDDEWRKARFTVDSLNKMKNVCSKTVKDKFKAKEPQGDTEEIPEHMLASLHELDEEEVKTLCIQQLKKLSTLVADARKETEKKMESLETERNEKLRSVGNILHPTVPISNNEDENEIVRTVGSTGDENTKKYSHVDLIYMIDGMDGKRGAVTAGNRGYYLKGPAVALETALVAFSQQYLMEQDFELLSPPVFMCKDVMNEVAQLSQFDDELYKVIGKGSEMADDTSTDEKYLIATSEQPIAAYHRGDWLDTNSLPLRYCGVSECFRQEVGSHGRDTLGIFRVHQFKKVEQFVITSPKDNASWEMMNTMLANAEGFLQALGLPYQVVNIVSGALNLAAAKKLDVEAWFPGSKSFRELVSCSNCTDYQSRRLKIRYGQTKKMNEKTEYVHMLNSTLCATTRTICCILENYQVGEYGEENAGVVVPEVLRPFMPSSLCYIG